MAGGKELRVTRQNVSMVTTYDSFFNAMHYVNLGRYSLHPEYILMMLKLQSYLIKTGGHLYFPDEVLWRDTILWSEIGTSCSSGYSLYGEPTAASLDKVCDYRTLGGSLEITRGYILKEQDSFSACDMI